MLELSASFVWVWCVCACRWTLACLVALYWNLTHDDFRSWMGHLPYNMSPTQIWGIPNVGSHLVLLTIISTLSRLDVPNLQLLQSGNIQGTGTNSIIPVHKLDPNLVQWLSRDQQTKACKYFFVDERNTAQSVFELKVFLRAVCKNIFLALFTAGSYQPTKAVTGLD